jgi:hypothetical protein
VQEKLQGHALKVKLDVGCNPRLKVTCCSGAQIKILVRTCTGQRNEVVVDRVEGKPEMFKVSWAG